MNIGHQIIGEIIKQGMVQIEHPDPKESHVLVWSANAADQLEALVMDKSVGHHAALELAAVLTNAGAPTFQDSTHAHEWGNEIKRKLARLQLLEAALDQTLCCSNGHYNPLMKCDCYQKAHDSITPKV